MKKQHLPCPWERLFAVVDDLVEHPHAGTAEEIYSPSVYVFEVEQLFDPRQWED